MRRDLGTYFLKVEFQHWHWPGYIQEWHTGWRYTEGAYALSPLDATAIQPTWETEEELFDTMICMYTDGNYSCDCNKILFCRRAMGREDGKTECGNELGLLRLTAIRPDRTEVVLWEDGETKI